ncbi:MAG: protein kinase [Acidobacteriota bacterium]
MENLVFSRYEILEKLGEGGMGVVYKARDPRLDRLVALKFLPPRLLDSAEARRRFANEARAISLLNHPNIAAIYDISEDGGAPVLVLEYLPGGTLRSRTEGRRLPLSEVIECGLQIAGGLGYAHRRGIVHRDVKPENMLFAEDGRLKITDFGLARLDDGRTVTLDGMIAGTPAYIAPECARGLAADHRADIFSLGVVLYEMAAGERLFWGELPQGELPEAFERIVRRATARAPERRYPSMEELAADLRRLPTEAPAPVRSEAHSILVIEDEEDLRTTMELSLSEEGYRVLTAGNGREGVRAAIEERPDLVLLDVMLPGLNGLDVCRELRRRGFLAPIIMVTGKAEEIDRVVGLEIGADDYVIKPFGRRELLSRIRAHLRRECYATAAMASAAS